MPGMLALALPTPAATGRPPSRVARWSAVSIDLALGAAFGGVAVALAFGWLLVRTSGGLRDVPAGDAAFAFALVMASAPAWLAWLAYDLATRGATPGQRARGLFVLGSPSRRVLRLAFHPLGAIGWSWLALVSWIAVIPLLPLLFASVWLVVLAGGITTALLSFMRPGHPAVHDRLAYTRIARAHETRAETTDLPE